MSGKHKPKEPTEKEENDIRKALNKYCFMGDLSVELGYTNNWVEQRLYYLLKLRKVKRIEPIKGRSLEWRWIE